MTLRDDNLRMATLKVLADLINAELESLRADHLKLLVEEYQEKGSKNFNVSLPGDPESLGQIVLSQPTEKFVVDEVALLEWAKKERQGMVEHVVVPPLPQQEFDRLLPASLTALKKRLKYDKKRQVVLDGDDIVPGVKYTPPARPNQFAIKLTEAGKAELLEAYKAGVLTQIEAASPAMVELRGAPEAEHDVAPFDQ